jgi:hypothetical protein
MRDRGDAADMLREQSRRMLEMVKENIRMRAWCHAMGNANGARTGEVLIGRA